MTNIRIAYLFPNLITAFSIFCGILSVLYAQDGRFGMAVYMILGSAVLDTLDGRVARMTNSQSKFGLEFDSLADIVAFGVAPGFLVYFIYGQTLGKLGILVTAMFVIFGAVRLARFNSVTHDSSVFLGLPIPAAAMFIATLSYALYDFQDGQFLFLLACVVPIVAILMVSNVRYSSFKKGEVFQGHVLKILVFSLIVLCLVYLFPIKTVLLLTGSYVSFGVIKMLYNIVVRKTLR